MFWILRGWGVYGETAGSQDQARSQSTFSKSERKQENWSAWHQRGTPRIAIFPKQLSSAEKDPQGPSLLHKELAVSGWASKDAKLAEDLLEGAGSSEM